MGRDRAPQHGSIYKLIAKRGSNIKVFQICEAKNGFSRLLRDLCYTGGCSKGGLVMKPIFAFILLNLFMTTSNADVLICQSFEKVDGWIAVDTHDYVRFSAYVESETVLRNPEISGAYSASLDQGDDGTITLANADKNSQYPRYRFEAIEDAWHWFFLMLPKNYLQTKGKFKASLQMYREEVYSPEYIDMSCFVKNAQKSVEIM